VLNLVVSFPFQHFYPLPASNISTILNAELYPGLLGVFPRGQPTTFARYVHFPSDSVVPPRILVSSQGSFIVIVIWLSQEYFHRKVFSNFVRLILHFRVQQFVASKLHFHPEVCQFLTVSVLSHFEIFILEILEARFLIRYADVRFHSHILASLPVFYSVSPAFLVDSLSHPRVAISGRSVRQHCSLDV
jgi:hypothetical protein